MSYSIRSLENSQDNISTTQQGTQQSSSAGARCHAPLAHLRSCSRTLRPLQRHMAHPLLGGALEVPHCHTSLQAWKKRNFPGIVSHAPACKKVREVFSRGCSLQKHIACPLLDSLWLPFLWEERFPRTHLKRTRIYLKWKRLRIS